MTVTDIKEYKKGKYEIYLNDEFAFILYNGELKEYGITKGCEVKDTVISDITDNVLTKRAKKRAMNLLLKGDMTESKLREKLLSNKYPLPVIDRAVDYVKSYNYIDDRRYAMSFIANKSGSYSKNTIRCKLIERGIQKDVIDSCIEEYYINDELNFNVERDLIKKLILKKCANVAALEYTDRQKLIASVMRKGFSFYDVESVMSNLT